jgi:large subunit ribosomal protein L1
MKRRGKKYRAALEKFDRETLYLPEEAIKLVKEVATARFDETVELHVKLGIDPRQADQQLRGTINLPHGTGKEVRVIVFAQGEKATQAKEAGADEVGGEELAQRIQEGWLDFEVAVATPDMMKVVSKLGRILGPRGLMPNPKSGTVTEDVGKAVQELKRGRVEYRSDKFGLIHLPIGKVSFKEEQLLENYLAAIEEIARAKPASSKGRFIQTVTLTTTMGPGIKIDPLKAQEVSEEAV